MSSSPREVRKKGQAVRKLFFGALALVFTSAVLVSAWLVQNQAFLVFPYYNDTSHLPAAERAEPLIPGANRIMVGAEGKKIEAWELVPDGEPRGIEIVFRANGGRLADHSTLVQWAKDHHLVGVVFNYPGMGLSEGTPSEESILEAGEEVYQHFRAKYLKSGGKTWIVGYSVGTGPAGIFAAKHKPDLLVLFAPYTDIKDVVARLPVYHFLANFLRFRFPLELPIASLDKTDFIVATGGADTTIPPELSTRVFEFYKGSGRKFFIQNPTGLHDRLFGANEQALDSAVAELGYQ